MTEQNSIAACEAVPEKEPFRQQYYMELVRTIVAVSYTHLAQGFCPQKPCLSSKRSETAPLQGQRSV